MDAAPHNIQTEQFEVDQYVRVQLSTGRYEIGVVVSIHENEGTAVIATRHGYEMTVRLSSVRRAFLLVLDLNGVLVSRGRGTFVDRPGVDEFINFVMNNFVVAVWTSGLERTSNPIIEKIFDGFQDRLLFRFYRDACTEWPLPGRPYCTIKNLQRIFDAYPKSFHAVNTIIVDDSPDKCSHPDIALCPVPFSDPERQADDRGLALAMEVLREVLRVESHAPLIRASEDRLVALAAQEREREREKKKEKEEKEEKERKEEKEKEKLMPAGSSNAAGDGRVGASDMSVRTMPQSASPQLDLPKIISLLTTNPDHQKEQQERSEGRGGRYTHPKAEWSKNNRQPPQQQQQQQQQQQGQRKPNQRQKETRSAGHQKRQNNSASLGEKGTNNEVSSITNAPWYQKFASHGASASVPVEGKSAPVRFMGDTQDGGALLRQLQESLLVSKGGEASNARSHRGRQRPC